MEIVCFAHAVTQKNHKVSGFAEYILKKKKTKKMKVQKIFTHSQHCH